MHSKKKETPKYGVNSWIPHMGVPSMWNHWKDHTFRAPALQFLEVVLGIQFLCQPVWTNVQSNVTEVPELILMHVWVHSGYGHPWQASVVEKDATWAISKVWVGSTGGWSYFGGCPWLWMYGIAGSCNGDWYGLIGFKGSRRIQKSQPLRSYANISTCTAACSFTIWCLSNRQ